LTPGAFGAVAAILPPQGDRNDIPFGMAMLHHGKDGDDLLIHLDSMRTSPLVYL
jgi:hypothetical protein